jgi:N-acetylglucosaminyl-diphospho-decaprenol L-rhamnosyltransferase
MSEEALVQISRCNVVVVTYNNALIIAGLLKSLDFKSQHIEQLVLVDNGSQDNTVDVVGALIASLHFPLTLIRSSNTGFAGGYLGAGRHVINEKLPTLCINPDVVLEVHALPRLLEAMSTWRSIGVATVPLVGQDGVEDSASRRRLPALGSSVAYALFGKLLPRALRYNSRGISESRAFRKLADGTKLTPLEATTGALMLVAPHFRAVGKGIFDTDYWMYGEDLQLCHDARTEKFEVVMVESAPSIHEKGASSGWPRTRRSNAAFHDAMYIYSKKNLHKTPYGGGVILVGVKVRQAISLGLGAFARANRSAKQRRLARTGRIRALSAP